MAPAGRPRKRPPNLPAHIEHAKLPAGIYWRPDRQCWIVFETRADGSRTTKRIAGADAKLSELHALVEARQGVDRHTLNWLADQFAASPQHAALAPSTRTDYAYCRRVICEFRLRDRRAVGELDPAKFTRPFVQRVVDWLAKGDGDKPTPAKASHVRRYLQRLFRWGAQRGHMPPNNAADDIDAPKQRAQRRLPEHTTMAAVLRLAVEAGRRTAHTKGSVAPYLWACMELAYGCRLRGAELIDLTDASATERGIISARRKGSRTTVNTWTPRLRVAWDALAAYRAARTAAHRRITPIRPDQRRLLVAEDGTPLSKSSLDSAWQRLMHLAIAEGVIAEADRFGLHDLKRRGVTDTQGTRADKLHASGHKSPSMGDVYDLSVPEVTPAAEFYPGFYPERVPDTKKDA